MICSELSCQARPWRLGKMAAEKCLHCLSQEELGRSHFETEVKVVIPELPAAEREAIEMC